MLLILTILVSTGNGIKLDERGRISKVTLLNYFIFRVHFKAVNCKFPQNYDPPKNIFQFYSLQIARYMLLAAWFLFIFRSPTREGPDPRDSPIPKSRSSVSPIAHTAPTTASALTAPRGVVATGYSPSPGRGHFSRRSRDCGGGGVRV